MNWQTFNRWIWLPLLLVAVAFPLLSANTYLVAVIGMAFITGIAALGLNLLAGFTGQLNLAHGSFMAVGAYVVGILCVDHGWGYWPAFIASIALCCAFGALVGTICLRLRGHYFAIFTLCVGVILFQVIDKWEAVTHGTVGIMGIPPPSLGELQFDTPLTQYYLALGFLLAAWLFTKRIIGSLIGRSFIAVRNSEALAESIGIPLMRTKMLSFVLSVGYAAVAGALYAGNVRFLGPDLAAPERSFEQLMDVLVGGLGTVAGPILGSILVSSLTQWLQFLQEYRMLVFGPLLLLLLIYLPHGLLGNWFRWQARQDARRRT